MHFIFGSLQKIIKFKDQDCLKRKFQTLQISNWSKTHILNNFSLRLHVVLSRLFSVAIYPEDWRISPNNFDNFYAKFLKYFEVTQQLTISCRYETVCCKHKRKPVMCNKNVWKHFHIQSSIRKNWKVIFRQFPTPHLHAVWLALLFCFWRQHGPENNMVVNSLPIARSIWNWK